MGYVIKLSQGAKSGKARRDRRTRRARPKKEDVIDEGPGTELKKILARFGIRHGVGCKCERRVKIMDQRGPKWCRENIDEIVGWLKEEADKRNLPFVKRLGKYIVNRAIKNSLKSGET